VDVFAVAAGTVPERGLVDVARRILTSPPRSMSRIERSATMSWTERRMCSL